MEVPPVRATDCSKLRIGWRAAQEPKVPSSVFTEEIKMKTKIDLLSFLHVPPSSNHSLKQSPHHSLVSHNKANTNVLQNFGTCRSQHRKRYLILPRLGESALLGTLTQRRGLLVLLDLQLSTTSKQPRSPTQKEQSQIFIAFLWLL